MSVSLAAIVLFAAFLHAFWNALVKGADDKLVIMGLVSLGHVMIGGVIVLFLPLPGWDAVPFIIASTVIHWLYYWLLASAYRMGDLSLIYPVARGLAPVLIALGAQFWVGENLPALAWAGVLTVSAGIIALTLGRKPGPLLGAGLPAALGVAIMVSTYSLVDGVGVRTALLAWSYIGWLFVAEISVVAFVALRAWPRLRALTPRQFAIGILGGLVSALAYGLVLYVKTLAPLGIVSALRETSVVIATIIGVVWFGEGPKRIRIISGIIVAAGIGLIAISAQ